MKKLFSLMAVAAIALMFCSCSEQKGYVIEGRAVGIADGTVVRVAVRNKPDWITVDSAVVKAGAFRMEGELDPAVLAYITVGDDRMMVVVEPGTINVDLKAHTVGGTELNNRLMTYWQALEPLEQASDSIYERMDLLTEADSIERRACIAQMEQIDSTYMALTVGLVNDNIQNALGVGMFVNNLYLFQDDTDNLSRLAEAIPEPFRAQAPVSETLALVKTILATAVGGNYVDFDFTTSDGRATSLKAMVDSNRYVLVDFWASWCAPCRASLPGIKALYEDYRDRGFAVLGVSLDREEADWRGALDRFGMTWTQTSDLKYWDSAYAALYGVRAIPATVLIRHDGVIVARNADEAELRAMLDKEL